MGNDREELKNLSEERVGFPREMAVTNQVWAALEEWKWGANCVKHPVTNCTCGDSHMICGECRQSVMVLWKAGIPYKYSDDEIRGARLAHLIQSHGWTRETPYAEQS